jgi:hypothetical protein
MMKLQLKGALKSGLSRLWRSKAAAAQAVTHHSIVDASLVSLGVAAAAGSMTFAAYMLAQDAHAPMVHDMQYLALFAQPRRSPASANARSEPAPASELAPSRFANVDMTPTGSIDSSGGDVSGPRTWRIVGGRADVVYLGSNDSIRAVRVGDTVDGLGEVASIAWRDGSWRLLDASGRSLLAQAADASEPDAGAARFSRRMIFNR